jgi:hypothetical protein
MINCAAVLLLQMADSIKDSPPAEHIPRSPLKLFRILAQSPLLPFFCLVGIMLSMASHTYIFWLPIIISALLRGTALTQTSVAAKAPAAGAPGGVVVSKLHTVAAKMLLLMLLLMLFLAMAAADNV